MQMSHSDVYANVLVLHNYVKSCHSEAPLTSIILVRGSLVHYMALVIHIGSYWYTCTCMSAWTMLNITPM